LNAFQDIASHQPIATKHNFQHTKVAYFYTLMY